MVLSESFPRVDSGYNIYKYISAYTAVLVVTTIKSMPGRLCTEYDMDYFSSRNMPGVLCLLGRESCFDETTERVVSCFFCHRLAFLQAGLLSYARALCTYVRTCSFVTLPHSVYETAPFFCRGPARPRNGCSGCFTGHHAS